MAEEIPEDAMQFKNVFHTVKSIFDVFLRDEVIRLPEVQHLIQVCKNVVTSETTESNSEQRKPFIVLEGLDGSGKTTVSRVVAEKLNATLMSTPPSSLLHLRQKFDQFSPDLRRAFYALGNYVAADEVELLCKTKPVVMDRFWHSTAAYGIAEELDWQDGLSGLPPVGSPLYNWPEELLKPDCVLLLTVSEETRKERVGRRDLVVTEEEKKLADRSSFRTILLEAYKRMENPPLILIDANQDVENVVADVMNHLSNHIKLPIIDQDHPKL